MNILLKLKEHPNIWGSLASALCLVHCVATPFLFAVHAGHLSRHHTQPSWWGFIDIFFIIISFLAIYWSVKNTSKKWMKYALWNSWIFLFVLILNEKIRILEIAEVLIYVPSIALILLHLYNRNYCQCADEDCCVH